MGFRQESKSGRRSQSRRRSDLPQNSATHLTKQAQTDAAEQQPGTQPPRQTPNTLRTWYGQATGFSNLREEGTRAARQQCRRVSGLKAQRWKADQALDDTPGGNWRRLTKKPADAWSRRAPPTISNARAGIAWRVRNPRPVIRVSRDCLQKRFSP